MLKTKVLIVDDEHAIADTLALILERSGYEVATAYSGEQAVNTASTFFPDIVIADYDMPPGMDGLQTCVKIQALLPGCRTLMLSGRVLTEPFAPLQARGYSFTLLSLPATMSISTLSRPRSAFAITASPRLTTIDD